MKLFKQRNRNEASVPGPTIREFAEKRMYEHYYELDAKLDALCRHLGVRIQKKHGYEVKPGVLPSVNVDIEAKVDPNA